jgi:hypothetical protein
MAKKIDPKAKAKRQKIIAIAGAVLLVLILVVELPSTLKQLNPPRTDTAPASTGPTSTVVTPAAGTLAPPTLAGQPSTPSAAAVVAAGQLVATDGPAAPSTAKLVSFSLFVSKDPFRQQVSAGATPPDGSGTTASTTTPTTTTPTTPAPPNPPPVSTAPAAAPTSVVIDVNGTSETVAVGKTFPAAATQPFFQLVSVTPTSAKIGIAGGSLTNGKNTVTIPVGKTVTLMNTADGTKYTIKLVSVA